MQYEMLMPKMGESIMEGTILKWLKIEGDIIEKDETILEISTDKVDSEIPAPVSGKIMKLVALEGDTVDVGTAIALIETDKNATLTATSKSEASKETTQEIETEEKVLTPFVVKEENKESIKFYSPVVLNMANENNISFTDLENIPGTGLNGRVTKKDILKYLEGDHKIQKPPHQVKFLPGKGVEEIPMDHVRKSIAKHMVHSVQTSAHVSLYTEVDMNNISKIRENNKNAFNSREGFNLTYVPFIAEAVIKSLKEYPMLNASIDGDKILLKRFINLGIAVAVDYGLIVPNIFNADESSLVGLARAIDDIARRARNKKLKPDEIANGTFSISNFGVYGTTLGFPIINQPQVAILGVGAIKKRPVVINDAIAIRPILNLALTIDHRLIDGAMGAQFLQRIGQLLEEYDTALQV